MSYYTERDAEGAMKVIAGWIGQNPKVKVEYHNGTAVDADIDTGRIRIPRLACASGITEEALMLLRTQIYHEAGHICETKMDRKDYLKGSRFDILNALEDRRMERVLTEKHEGCRMVFKWSGEYFSKLIAGKISGGVNAPLWEALCAMGLMVDGVQPAWRLTPKAQKYFDVAYDTFAKVRSASNTYDCKKIAEEIHKLLKDVNEQEQREQQKKEQEEKKKQEKEDKKQEKKEEKKEKEEKKQGKKQEEKKEKKEEKGEKQEDEKGEKEEKDAPQQKGHGDIEDEDGDEAGDENGKGESDEEGKEEGEEKESSGKGKGDEEEEGEEKESSGSSDMDEEGDEGEEGEDGDDGEEAKGEGKAGNDKEGDDTESDGVDGDNDSEGSDGDNEGESGSNDSGDDEYKPDNSGKVDTKQIEKQLDEEAKGDSCQDMMNEKLDEVLEDIPDSDKEYLALRDNDKHVVPEATDRDKVKYINIRAEVAVAVVAMTQALDQALRALIRCRKKPYMRHGRIDKDRLVAISKGLSKEVFYRNRKGEELDVAVEIIIDESGSMNGSKYSNVQKVAIAVGESLAAIGIPFEITGTTTEYEAGQLGGNIVDDNVTRFNPMVYRHYKTFAEKWVSVRERIVKTFHYHHNIDGEAVEYAAFRLAQRKEARKVIFSLSDGEPCGGQGNDNEMQANLVRVCKRVRAAGIEVYGFGVLDTRPEQFYGKKYFVHLGDMSEMGRDFVRKFADVVTGGRVHV